MLYEWFAWVNDTAGSVALRESLMLWPIIEAGHVLAIMLFLGTIIMVDLRLLGLAFRDIATRDVTARVLPYTVAGFLVMVATGLLLLYAKPLTYYFSFVFRLKMLLLVLALGNVALFHWLERRPNPMPPRVLAVVSLSAWGAIVISGRMIAYDWFACEKLDPAGMLSLLTNCAAKTAGIGH